MPKKSVQEKVDNFLSLRAKTLRDTAALENLCMSQIGKIVCDMLTSGATVTLDSLQEECSRRREPLDKLENPEQNGDWHRLNAVLAHLQSLQK